MIAIGSDHGGYALKCAVMEHLKNAGLNIRTSAVFPMQAVIIRI